MKPYGNKRTENITCKYGCCSRGTVHKGTGYRVPKALLRRAKKRARQEGVEQCRSKCRHNSRLYLWNQSDSN